VSWSTLYTATSVVNAPAEGGEYEHSREEWKGEGHVVSYRSDYPHLPVVELAREAVVAGSVVVTVKASGKVLTMIDYTNTVGYQWSPSYPVPPVDTCYLHRRQGDDYRTARLYLSPDLEGQEIDVVYSYYTDVTIGAFTLTPDGEPACCESGERYRFLLLAPAAGATVATDYTPHLGDARLSVVATGDDALYGISMPSGLLVQRGTTWSGYIAVPVYGKDAPLWSLMGELARASDCYCYDERGVLNIRPRDDYTSRGGLKNVLSIEEKPRLPYKQIVLSYANGAVAIGEGKPSLPVTANFVYDKGHAEAIARSVYSWYANGRSDFVVVCNGVLDDEVLFGIKSFYYYDGTRYTRVIGVVTKLVFTDDDKTIFTISELVRVYDVVSVSQ